MGIQFEEHDLVMVHRKLSAGYRKRLPVLIPGLFGKKSARRRSAAHAKAAYLGK